MAIEDVSGADTKDLEPYREVLHQVDTLIASGDYEGGIGLMQRVARGSGNELLMQRLIELRVQAIPHLAEEVSLQPMYEANALLEDVSALRNRLDQDGYLFFRNIVPVQKLLQLRSQITEILAELGWIEAGAEQLLAKAICRPRREGQPKFFRAHDRIVKLEALHSLAHDTNLMHVMRQVLGDSVFPHPLSIVRLVFPDSPELATPPHQDFPNNQGTPKLTAAWMPLGDCRIKDGSLAILEGSHKYGVLPLQFHLGAGNRRAILAAQHRKCRWVGADYHAGDLVLFPALTVHKAMENHNTQNMRLSVDFRYQLEGEPLTEGCLQPHFARVSWEDIYRDWQSDALQYYWRKKHFVEVPWDPTLHELPEGHVDEAYEQTLAFNIALTRRKEARTAPDQD